MKNFILILSMFFLFAFVSSEKEIGKASYYANSMHGHKTFSGEKYYKDSLTAAHKSLPMGTKVKVTNMKNDSIVIVKINDRMSAKGRIIDLSMAAAKKLNFVNAGITTVTVEVVE